MSYPPEFGEDELKWKFERCVNDLALKTLTATLLSFTGAKMLLPNKHLRKAMLASWGAAVGLAWYNCEKEMQLSMRICKDGVVDKVLMCEECRKNMEERKKEREKQQKEREERMKRIQKEMERKAKEELSA